MSDPGQIPGARHLASRLTAESVQSRQLLRATDREVPRQLLPNLVVVKLGGSSILDRGPEALLPVIQQLVELRLRSLVTWPAAEVVTFSRNASRYSAVVNRGHCVGGCRRPA